MIREQNLAGRRLAGYRQLTVELGVCKQTLQRALAAMEADGIVERRHGSGTYVLDEEQRRARAAALSLAVIVRRRSEVGCEWSAVGEMVTGLEAQARRVRTACRLYSLDIREDGEELLDARAMRAHAGFILLRLADPLLISRLLRLVAGPVVVVDEPVHGQPVVWVTEDSFDGASQVAKHLLRLGHRRIGFLDVDDRQRWNPTKHAGYCAALEEAGLSVDQELTVSPAVGVPADGPEAPHLVDEAVESLLSLENPPTAIFAYDDLRAVLVCEGLRRRGLEPGRDVSVAGFGDTASRLGTSDELTSCRIDFARMGREAVRGALRPMTAGEGRSLLIRDRLVVRSSTAAPCERGKEQS
jgi:DNA-binding LacI/PurR family transcriptional regulator